MAKSVYVGVNNVARKVKNIYVGVSGVARKVKAVYVGVNGVARQVYNAVTTTIEAFNTNPAPTTWTITDNYYKAQATNTYGTWVIEGDNTSTIQNTSIDKGFDSDLNSYYMAKITVVSTGIPTVTTLKLPTGVSIQPTSINIKHFRSTATANSCFVQGKNEETEAWENLLTLSNSSSAYITDSATLTGTPFYTEFRISAYSRNNSMNFEIENFEIASGNIKY